MAGRPPTFGSAKRLERKINYYFKTEKSPTVSGLAYYLGFASKQSLYDYEKIPEFSYPIKRARLLLEDFHEKGLNGQYSSGHIFALKNMGWSDKQEITHNAADDIREKYLKSLENMYADKVGEQQIQPKSKEVSE
jgi:hypothetical protein